MLGAPRGLARKTDELSDPASRLQPRRNFSLWAKWTKHSHLSAALKGRHCTHAGIHMVGTTQDPKQQYQKCCDRKCHNKKNVMIVTGELHDYSIRMHIWLDEAVNCNCQPITGSDKQNQKHSQSVQR